MNKTAFAVLSSALLLAACSKSAPPEEPVRAVKVMTVGTDSFATTYEFAGEVKAQVESRLGFRVGGKIIRRQADLGQRVQAGQVLAQLDPQDYKLAADAARAQVAAAATQRDLASADYKRYKELRDQNFISGAELERRETTLKAAQAQLDQAQSQLAVQGNQANYAVLVADVSGVVTAVEAEVGQVVAAGTPVLRIAADGPRDVVFSVPEDKVAAIKVGMPVKVRVWAQNAGLEGKVREVGASADPLTRTYPVKVALATREPPVLGATVYVQPQGLSAAGVQVIKLPTTALRQEGRSTAVWVLDKASMTVKSQLIEVATADGNEAVVASGLQPGMLVVSAGVHVLSPGQKVTIYQPKVAAALSPPAQIAINPVASAAAATLPLAAPAAAK
ncbi:MULTISPECIES: efflux RND transporter periplasmic adaptor subunit [unclassified Polaromonas]|jgi:RND family efflux transporter MFP subunit|uniref:efflux RND transporter periplasmic adaptor subunit n=1 Tax=unclassified Polaromonas TaxID=2638319 RepID=UPI000BD00FE0|nr:MULTISPECIES: efflux RND transporter periplasmic adaptor subunit [unclassified Polaromonas]OYY34980.1 MAG: efflux transporter periplasmic adaptor subunit [Polaromonas sp. 35-63-35]OYZ13439.1 MAG: efflux transporter periplasmic adaptor subunit [Polaromonas sp. 16-63-31]OYZ77873.1 MAG: efflux transporter periplasmic adaptor subunit [Polaromonas sp. 24-63-21]OZA49383.1 MAG: efflux transporter periplasmic adaptor subunit [Polaromonas sp. 17-63-33]OZA87484.1 MAG: efflux transporter periplasmic a